MDHKALDKIFQEIVDGTLTYLQKLISRFRNKSKIKHLKKLAGYIERNRDGIWYDEAGQHGISIGAGSADKMQNGMTSGNDTKLLRNFSRAKTLCLGFETRRKHFVNYGEYMLYLVMR